MSERYDSDYEGLTADEILAIGPGTKLQFNYDVHVQYGPRAELWNKTIEVLKVVYRGRTAPMHPMGPGRPFCSISWVINRKPNGEPASWCTTSLATGDRHCRVVVAEQAAG